MSFENEKLMNLEDGQLLLSAVDKRKADIISVSDTTPEPVKTIPDGSDGMPMGVTVGIEPVQAGSGDPSPSNVRAISGWDAVKINRTGGNLFDLNTVTNGYNIGETGSISSNSSFSYSALIPVKTGGKYALSFISATASSTHTRIHGYNASGTWVQQIMDKVTTSDSLITDSFTIPSGVSQIRISYRTANTEVTISALDEYEIAIPSTPGTVYGGSLTVNKDGTGKLVVTHGMTTIPEITEFHDSTSGTGKCVWVSSSGTNTNVSSFPPICENVKGLAFVSRGAAWTASISTTAGRTLVFVPADLTIAEANTALQGSKIVYRRATPAEYTLTAEQVNALITSLKGVNNLYADSGDVLSVDYSADTKLYVDEHNEAEDTAIASIHGMIADSDAPVATASHAIGDVFICSDQLLRATSAIATGETIAVGTNAEILNLADYIAEKATAIAGVQNNVDLLEEKAIALGLSPMNRRIFPNYNKGLQTGANTNLRYVDVLFNTIRSEGHTTLTGSTYRGVLMTSTNGARLPGANLNGDFTMYKSDFKLINTPTLQSGIGKLVAHIAQSGNNAGSANGAPITMLYTYDANGHIKKVLIGAPSMTQDYDLDWYFILPSEFTTNKNICVGVNFMTPKQSIGRKIEFMFVLESLLPESMQTLTIADTGMTVQDDPT